MDPASTHSFSHKHADACLGVEESIRDGIKRPGQSFQFLVLREIPPLHGSEFGVLVVALGEGAIFSCFVLYQGRQALLFVLIEQKPIRLDRRQSFLRSDTCIRRDYLIYYRKRTNLLRGGGRRNPIIWASEHIGTGQASIAIEWRRCRAKPHTRERIDDLHVFSFIELENWSCTMNPLNLVSLLRGRSTTLRPMDKVSKHLCTWEYK